MNDFPRGQAHFPFKQIGNIYGNILSEYEKPETEAGDFPVTLGQRE